MHPRNLGRDLRSNLTAGGKVDSAPITDAMTNIAEVVRSRLVQDGMFLVGMDIVGDKVLEINVFSPGGLFSASRLAGVDFFGAILDSIERKVELRKKMPGAYTNSELATH